MTIFAKNIHLFRPIKINGLSRHFSKGGVRKWSEELSPDLKKEIERHWRSSVMDVGKEKYPNEQQSKFYVLSMFPYPSGQLHMGHVRVYSISDTIARFQRLNGNMVIHPMGWDAFGLPAENAAIHRKVAPRKWTEENIGRMKNQLNQLGCLFDWDRELNTSSPDYYKWTQKLFLKLFKAGLTYKKYAFVNWDPVDQTVLADEQVDINGNSWRSGARVEKKLLNQWFIKTTTFAKHLYDGLDDPELTSWRDIVQLQRHWIGECNGVNIDFPLIYPDNAPRLAGDFLTVWTDKAEMILSTRFICVPSNSVFNSEKNDIKTNNAFKKSSVFAENPITGDKIPVFISDEVIYPEGSTTYLGCPDINELDLNFIEKAQIPRIQKSPLVDKSQEELQELREAVCHIAKEKNVGGHAVSAKLKDWLISRQRYWGTPIPVVECNKCGLQPLPEDQLPVVLPELDTYDTCGLSPLASAPPEWVTTSCPKCGGAATRETDTMDTFVDSSWYFLRYLDAKNKNAPYDKKKVWDSMPVDLYIGGKEHAVLHLYYARFINYFLHSIGDVPEKEPFKNLLVQGMVKGKSFRVKETGNYVPENDVKVIDRVKGTAVTLDTHKPVEIVWEKMSKSKHNGVDPSELLEEYGCDTTRLFMLGNVTPTSERLWSDETFPGILNWQHKIWITLSEFIKSQKNPPSSQQKNAIISSDRFLEDDKNLCQSRNRFVMHATFNYRITYQLSVAISRLQALTGTLRKASPETVALSKQYQRALGELIIMLSPIAPHFCSELWDGFASACDKDNVAENSIFDWNTTVLNQRWPRVDDNYPMDLIIKVDGLAFQQDKILAVELNQLTHQVVLEKALQQKKIIKAINNDMRESKFELYPDYKAYLKILTNKSQRKMKASAAT